MNPPSDVSLEAQRINRAWLAHVASLGLDLDRKRVLEVGAGTGQRTEFFEQRGCDVLSTDGAAHNLAEMLRLWPHRRLGLVDLDNPTSLRGLGTFDVVCCYGTLYHLRDPDGALARLAEVCNGLILLEMMVSRGSLAELNSVIEPPSDSRIVSGIGCRPSRSWVMVALRRHLGHAYTTVAQPDHPDFVTDWSMVHHDGNLRAMFVGARQKLALPTLTTALPIRHRHASTAARQASVARVWIEIGADRADQSRVAAQHDPEITVHALESLPSSSAQLADDPPNHHAHPVIVGEQDGMATFSIDGSDKTISVHPVDEATRNIRNGGHELREAGLIQLPVMRLDSFMLRHGIRRVESLKVDVQERTLAVLRSAGDRLADIDRVQVRLAAVSHDRRDIVDYIGAHGFHDVDTGLAASGQEENLTFVHADASVASPEPSTAAISEADDHLRAMYDFAGALCAHGEISRTADHLEVTTDSQQWAYAAVVPIGAALRDADTSSYQVELSVQVEQGVVQIGILNRAEDDFPSAATVAANPVWRPVMLFTPTLDCAGPLVIRNASDTGPSRARIRLVAVTRLAAALPAPEKADSQPSLMEAEVLAAQIQASSQSIAPMTAADADLAAAVAPSVVAAVLPLRGALVRGGMALISARTESIESVFATLTTEQLLDLACATAMLAPLRPVPGWRMDGFLESGELATFVRYAIWQTLQQRESVGPAILPWHGGTRLGLTLGNDLGRAVFVSGSYEPNEFALLDGLVKPGMTVLDGGANEGAYALFLAARVGEAGRVIAVEPSPRELQRLHANVALNGMTQITIVAVALAEQPGEVELLLAEMAHAGQNTLGSFMYQGVAAAGAVRVAATTIDELARAQGLTALDVIKLDLEGAELRALSGARNTLLRWRPLLVFEAAEAALARQGGSLQGVLSLLAECGYRVFCIDPATGLLAPLGITPISDNLVAVHPERDWGLVR